MTPTDLATPPTAEPAVPPAHPDLLAEPTFEECLEEDTRLYEDKKAGRVDYRDVPDGHYVAYYGGKLYGHDPDGWALQTRVAAALGIHWARVVIDYPWRPFGS